MKWLVQMRFDTSLNNTPWTTVTECDSQAEAEGTLRWLEEHDIDDRDINVLHIMHRVVRADRIDTTPMKVVQTYDGEMRIIGHGTREQCQTTMTAAWDYYRRNKYFADHEIQLEIVPA